MSDRKDIAWRIQDACNPSGVTHELLRQMEKFRETEAFTGTTSLREDPALRAIAYKLADLFNVADWNRWSELHDAIAPRVEDKEGDKA